MQKKLLFLLLTVIFSCLGMEVAAKVKTTELCPFLKFEGVVEKEKGTNAKIPVGNGVLYIPVVDAVITGVEIKGDYAVNNVSNAEITIYRKKDIWTLKTNPYCLFSGELTYQYQYDKKTKDFNLEVVLGNGKLSLYSDFSLWCQIPISKDMDMRFVFSNVDHGSMIEITPLPTKLQLVNNEMPKEFPNSFSKYVARNIWALNFEYFSGLITFHDYTWVKTELKNGMTVFPDEHGIKITGENKRVYYDSESRFRLPLKDGGFLEYLNGSFVRLIYPNGDIYEGSFTSVPFEYKDSNHYYKDGFDVKDEFDYRYGPEGDCELYSTIIESSSTDYKIKNGNYTHKSGKVERVKDGNFPDRLLENNSLTSSLPTYASLVTDATELSGSDAIDKFNYLSSSDFWGYIGKSSLSDLDKELYKETDEYKSKYSQFNAAVSNQKFYTILPISGKVSTTNAQFTKGFGLNPFEKNKLPVMAIPDNSRSPYIGFPMGKNSIHKNSYVIAGERYTDDEFAFDVNSTDIKFLKYLQDASEANETALLMIYKPGVYVEIDEYGYHRSIATPLSLYLINKKTKTVLYDLSKYIDKDPTKYIGIFSRIVASEKAERREPTYHSEPLRKHCYECGGDGIVEGVNLYMQPGVTRAKCRSCNGKGYTETHYY